ncbi:SlyX family protein [Novispirillum itersonii]|uniref:SlyX protein n=1 Tax=Novispirillum itersonii TaxID=189 RepID=A0A7W9ZHT0_NOVIT|nr:SlyX family protein [Novispirillum itersonii]MBB6210524.1 SlyX protein [Novispirillum itersonii]
MTDTAPEIAQLQERINELEGHVAHLELAQQEMSDQMAAQWDQIDRMTRTLELMHRKMTSLEPAHEVTKPPHY